ncbi:MAG: lysophospholipid acyltransferase family protein [Cellulosilyticaceae bacterium]
MIRSVRVVGFMTWHYVRNTLERNKYTLKGKDVDVETKKVNRKKIYRLMQSMSNGMVKAAGTEVIVKGKENLPKHGPVVYMSTHKGLYDSPVLATIIEEPIIFIGKEEMEKMPIIGSWFDAMGCIYLARDDMKKSLQAILTGIEELKNGQSIVIFPEGTRSKGKDMQEFKSGSFKLALKANVPIVPIAIQDTQKVLEDTGMIKKATVYVNIGKPFDVASMTKEEKKALPKTVENKVRELLGEITF